MIYIVQKIYKLTIAVLIVQQIQFENFNYVLLTIVHIQRNHRIFFEQNNSMAIQFISLILSCFQNNFQLPFQVVVHYDGEYAEEIRKLCVIKI